MPKLNTAPFPQEPKMGSVMCTLASTFGTTPSNPVLIGTIGVNDGILTRLEAIPLGSNTAMNLMVFLELPGSPIKALAAVKYAPATTVSPTAATWTPFLFDMSELNTRRLPKGTNIYVAISVALVAGMMFNIEWTDY